MFSERASQHEATQADVRGSIPPELKAVLDRHIVDIEPHQVGRRELAKRLGDAAAGAIDALVGRSDPPIDVESLTVARGKSKVLIGPNGSGKSTVFDALMERDNAFLQSEGGKGAIVFGKPSHERSMLRIARLDQEELLGSIGALTVREVLGGISQYSKDQFPIDWEVDEAYDRNLANQDVHVRIETLMEQFSKLFNMQDFFDRKVSELSGGERTKMALFSVLLNEPDVLLLDEPTNHLDIRSITKLMALFDRYKASGVAILSVSHVDWFLQEAGGDGVIEIAWDKKGRRVSESNSSYRNIMKDTSRERIPVIAGDLEWPQSIEYGYKQGEQLVQVPHEFTIAESPLQRVSFPGVCGGDMLIISGDNGSGKTKLMETIVLNRRDNLPKRTKGTQVAYLPQFWPEEVARGTVGSFFEWVKDGASPRSLGSSVHPQKPAAKAFVEIASALQFGGGRIGETWLRRPFSQLSGGEQRLLWFVAVGALRDVDMLILDEPTNHMDRDLQAKITRAIQTFPGAVMLSTHDRNLTTTLSRDAGNRLPVHLVLEKRAGKTTVTHSRESPVAYLDRIMRDARQEAKKVKL